MQEIASLTFQYDQFSEVMGMLWKRMLQDNKVAWRRVYKVNIKLIGKLLHFKFFFLKINKNQFCRIENIF